jgi:hypothetical protein
MTSLRDCFFLKFELKEIYNPKLSYGVSNTISQLIITRILIEQLQLVSLGNCEMEIMICGIINWTCRRIYSL